MQNLGVWGEPLPFPRHTYVLTRSLLLALRSLLRKRNAVQAVKRWLQS